MPHARMAAGRTPEACRIRRPPFRSGRARGVSARVQNIARQICSGSPAFWHVASCPSSQPCNLAIGVSLLRGHSIMASRVSFRPPKKMSATAALISAASLRGWDAGRDAYVLDGPVRSGDAFPHGFAGGALALRHDDAGSGIRTREHLAGVSTHKADAMA